MTAVKYYTFSEVPDAKTKKIDGVQEGGDTQNPLFNFKSDFFQKLQGVSVEDLGRSIPYVSLHTVDLNGEIIDDLNVKFFLRPIDLQGMRQEAQRGDRPIMSLKDVNLKTTLASGYLYYTDVVLTVTVHSPAVLAQTTITSLIFPGMPHLLEYGWNSPNEFLNDSKQHLLFQVVTYDLNINEIGEVVLVVRGKAFNDALNNAYLGDDGTEVKTDLANDAEADGIHRNKKKITAYEEHLKDAQRTGKQESNFALNREVAVSYKTVENRVRGPFVQEFKRRREQLSGLAKDGVVTLHDLVYTLCGDTLKALTESWPRVAELRFIYGDINETIRGTKIPTSLADFPIELSKLNALFKERIQAGQTVLTIQGLLNMVADRYVENEELWKTQMAESDAEYYNVPEIVINFTNKNGAGDKGIMEITFHDAKQGIPATTSKLPKGTASSEAAKRDVIGSTGLPVLKLGHANSFVKKVSLSQISDQALRAVLLDRMARDRVTTVRSTKPQSKAKKAVPVTPLTLPLKGSIEVLGHPEWKVFRSLYLETGIFLVDGVYKIMEVEQRLSADGYITRMVLMYN